MKLLGIALTLMDFAALAAQADTLAFDGGDDARIGACTGDGERPRAALRDPRPDTDGLDHTIVLACWLGHCRGPRRRQTIACPGSEVAPTASRTMGSLEARPAHPKHRSVPKPQGETS
jgi:hypothetical protein